MSDRFVLRIGQYRLGKTLGVGSFGKVKLAHHEITGHQVAVKIINKAKVKLMDMSDKIRREIKVLKLLYHPHIVRLYEIIDTTTDVFMIMEYISGGELFDYIVHHGKLSEINARQFFQQFVCGVDYIHACNIVHRDLKPENLLLDSRNQLRIADFGLSGIMRDGDFLKTSCGSPNYAAPEVISGKLYAGAEVDVWSVGVILFALLCGKLPFDDEHIGDLFEKIKKGHFTIPHHVSPGAADIIRKALVINPVQRITMKEIKAHPWFSVNLPLYLTVDPLSHTRHVKAIDQEIMREVLSKLVDCNSEELIKDLRDGVMSKGAVVYHLLLDYKWRGEAKRRAKQVVDAENARIKMENVSGDGVKTNAIDTLTLNEQYQREYQQQYQTMNLDLAGSVPTQSVSIRNAAAADAAVSTVAGTVKGIGRSQPRSITDSAIGDTVTQTDVTATVTATVGLSSSPISPSHIRSYGDAFLFEKHPMGTGKPGTVETHMPEMDCFIPRHMDQRWYLGISSVMRPSLIMQEVCRVLKYMEYEWHVVTPYDLCVRPLGVDPRTHHSLATSPTKTSNALTREETKDSVLESEPLPRVHRSLETRIRLRLFQLSPERFVLDFSRSGGDIFAFCDACAEMIEELDV